jgi:hypothetical protein
MKHTLRLMLVLALVLLFGAATASAAPTSANGQDRPVPIKASLRGSDTIDPTAPGCPEGTAWSWRFTSEGTGNMSHLGKVDYVLTHCTLRDEGRFKFGTITITAANGDTLVLSEEGTFDFEPEPPVAYLDLSWVVAGGSGRFENATGWGWGTGRTDVVGGFTDLDLHGYISYDASDRAGR